MKGILGLYFDAVYVISLAHRADRRERLAMEMRSLGLADPKEVEWVRAVSGEQCWAPGFFEAGPGAWGCLQSHLGILQNAIMEGKETILVLEDDATFHPRTPEMLEMLFKQVPADWDQVFLGGEHFDESEPMKHRPFIDKGRRVHRTHAFALRRKILPLVYQHIANYPDYMAGGEWHVDHQLGEAHANGLWKTYAPSWWIVGQKGGTSNIAERVNPDYWWHPKRFAASLPFIVASQGAVPDLAQLRKHVHFGNHLLEGTLQDSGLEKCLDDDGELMDWMKMISEEAIAMGMLPGMQHPGIDREKLSTLWRAGALDLAEVDLANLADYPFNGLFRHALNRKKRKVAVASLRSMPADVAMAGNPISLSVARDGIS